MGPGGWRFRRSSLNWKGAASWRAATGRTPPWSTPTAPSSPRGDFRMATYWRSAAKPVQAMLMASPAGNGPLGLGSGGAGSGLRPHGGQRRTPPPSNGCWRRPICRPPTSTARRIRPCIGPAGRRSSEPRPADPAARSVFGQARRHAPFGLGARFAFGGEYGADHPCKSGSGRWWRRWPAKEVRCVGVDGCCAPTFALSLTGWPGLQRRLARPQSLPEGLRESAAQVAEAMGEHPLLVGADGFFDTEADAGDAGLIVKGGAESVLCVGIKERGWGLALKVEDGSEKRRGRRRLWRRWRPWGSRRRRTGPFPHR